MTAGKRQVLFSLVLFAGFFVCLSALAGVHKPRLLCAIMLAMVTIWAAGKRLGLLDDIDWSWTRTVFGPLALAVAALAFLFAFRDEPYPLLLAAVACIYACVALGNNLLTGLLGCVDLSAAGMLAIGAYSGALLNTRLALPVWCSLPGGMVAGALAGFLLSLAARRLRGNEVAMATLAMTIVVQGIVINMDDLTGGPDGLGDMTPWGEALPWLGAPRRADFVIGALTLIVVWSLFRNLRRTRHWRAWIAVGDDEPAAMSCGIRPAAVTCVAFVLSGAVTGLAGAEYAHIQRYIAPGNFGLMESITVVCAVMLGGRGSLAGPPIAAAVLWLLPEQLQFAYFARMLLFGALLLLTLRFKPSGFVPLKPMRYPQADSDPEDSAPPDRSVDLQVNDLGKSMGGFEPVETVSLSVRSGECLAVVGPNGAGKTLTLDMITGYLVPSHGEVLLDGSPIQGEPPADVARRGIRRTFQESRLFPRMSVLEHGLVGAHANGKRSIFSALLFLPGVRREEGVALRAARQALALFDPDRFPPRENDLAPTFSFGNRRRIEIARCLAAKPLRVLVLDEPFVGMPAKDARVVGDKLRHALRHGAIIAVEHGQLALADFADRTLNLEAGHMVRTDTAGSTDGGRDAVEGAT